MNYARFKKKMEAQVLDHLPEEKRGWRVKMQKVPKVNRVLDGMVLMPPDSEDERINVGLTFYMEDYYDLYREGASIEELLDLIAQMTVECTPPDMLMESAMEPKKLKDQIIMELVHGERNRELLKTMPHRDFLDLAVIYRLLMKDPRSGYYCSTVNNGMLEMLEMTEEELFQTAREYMPAELPFGMQNFDNKVLILSNSQQMFGASAMLFPDVLDMACDILGGSICITPASKDRILVEKEEPERLRWMQAKMWELYHQDDDPDDLLSDQIYLYQRHSGQVTAAGSTDCAGGTERTEGGQWS